MSARNCSNSAWVMLISDMRGLPEDRLSARRRAEQALAEDMDDEHEGDGGSRADWLATTPRGFECLYGGGPLAGAARMVGDVIVT